jgi:hypothetical protein
MTEPAEPKILIEWERSPDYRRVFSNYFLLRFAPGDANITFSQTIDHPGSSLQNVFYEHINITMSWPHLKLLGEYVTMAVQEMERAVGPIVSVGITKEELQKQAVAIIKEFAIRKQ